MSHVTAFLDTNTLLHYERLDQVNWLEVLGATSVELVIAGSVVDELDCLKENHKLAHVRDRARALVKFLLRATSTESVAAISAAITLVIGADPVIEDKQYSDADDQMLTRIALHRNATPGGAVLLVTADLGLTLRARQRRVRVVALPEKLRLPDERDPLTREVERLKRENAELSLRLPIVKLQFSDSSGRVLVELAPEVEPDATVISSRMEELRERHPQIAPDEPLGAANPIVAALREIQPERLWPPPKNRHEYNAALDLYYRAYEEYLPELIAHENTVKRSAHLKIEMENSGGAPARDIDVSLRFPDGFNLYDSADLPTPPAPPPAPLRPGSALGRLQKAQALASFPGIRLPNLVPGNVSAATIRKTNSYQVDITIRQLKHRNRVALPTLVAIFPTPDSVRSFNVEYELHPSNHPRPTAGRLDVVCRYRQT